MAKLSDMEKVAEGLAYIKEAREGLEDLEAQYNEWIDEAAELGQDEYSDQLIEDKLEVSDFVSDLKFMEAQISSSAARAIAIGNLGKLPAAIRACNGLLRKGPNFVKLGKDMAAFQKSLAKAKGSLSDVRKQFVKKDRTIIAKKRDSEAVAAEKQARAARLAARVAKGDAVAAKPNDAIDVLDIGAIIEEENKK